MVSRYIMRGITMAVTLLLASSLCSAQKKTDWQRDLDSLAVWLPQKHYNLFMYRNRKYFEDGIAKLKKMAPFYSNSEMVLKIQQLLVKFGDAHTGANYPQEMSPNRIYPLGLDCYGKDYYVTTTSKKYKNLLGARITAINGHTMNNIENQFSSLVVVDSRSNILNIVPKIMAFAQIYDFFGIAKGDSIVISYEKGGTKGRTTMKTCPINARSMVNIMPLKQTMHIVNSKTLFTDTYMPDDKIYYVQYNRCWNRELEEKYGSRERAAQMPSFTEFSRRIESTLKEKDVKKLVFDLRYNGGGNSAPFTSLVKKLAEQLKDRKDIKCYAVIGRATFSSGILNSLDLKKYLNATFVGEVTAGCANHLGEIRSFGLPTSGLEIMYSTKYFRQNDITDGPIHPDVMKETAYDDFIHGTDPVLEWIKEQ